MTDNAHEITLTLSEYVRRMSSADAREWLPGPSETVVLCGCERVIKIDDVSITSLSPYFRLIYEDGHFWAEDDEPVTVSRIPY